MPWVGEETYCDARRALRIEPNGSTAHRPRCSFRRYHADGTALARIEVGIASGAHTSGGSSARISGTQLQTIPGDTPDTAPEVLAGALNLLFRTPTSEGSVSGNLLELRTPLARHLLRSTTRVRRDGTLPQQAWWLHPTPPLVVVECGACEEPALPRSARRVPIAEEHGVFLHTFTVALAKTAAKIWWLRTEPGASHDTTRRLRVHLLRLHADRMTLRHVLRLVALDRLNTNRGSEPFDRLQRYLLTTCRGLEREQSNGFSHAAILDAAYSADEIVSESERNTILDQLRQARLNIRRNIERSLVRESLANSQPTQAILNMNIEGNVISGDQYEVTGRAGAVGPNAHVDSARMEQIWTRLADEIDMDRLRGELDSLRQELMARRLTADDDRVILEITQAAQAAEQGNGPGILSHLARTGRWALSTAKDIGVDLAAAMIKELLC